MPRRKEIKIIIDTNLFISFLIGKIEKIIKEPEICRDPKDNFLLALSDKGKADYLVTGDTDLLTIGEYKNTKIITIDKLEKIIKESTNA